jgi:hypothetical protein
LKFLNENKNFQIKSFSGCIESYTVQQNHENSILFHETIPLGQHLKVAPLVALYGFGLGYRRLSLGNIAKSVFNSAEKKKSYGMTMFLSQCLVLL